MFIVPNVTLSAVLYSFPIKLPLPLVPLTSPVAYELVIVAVPYGVSKEPISPPLKLLPFTSPVANESFIVKE